MKMGVTRINANGIGVGTVTHIQPKSIDTKIVKHSAIHNPAASLQSGEQ